MHFPKLAAIATVAVLSIAACGGGAPAPTGAAATNAPSGATSPTAAPPVGATSPPIGGTVDVCSLLTPAEVSAATGKLYDIELPKAGGCWWNTEGSESNRGSLIAGYMNSSASHDQLRIQPGSVDTTVNGHAAVWNPGEFGGMSVDLGGGVSFQLGFPRSTDQQVAQTLAEIAVGRI